MEKLALLYDTAGSQYGVMTTNLVVTQHDNGVMILPLVGIVEFILYDCTNYFIKCHVAASLTFHNLSQIYGDRIIKYST
jgi:hypothetical protein